MRYNRENTLFVTDMDGTLLNTDSQLSAYTVDVLREVISRGYNFTVASGRVPESPQQIFEQHGLKLRLPIIGRNGVLIFDAQKSEYLKIHTLQPQSVARILEMIRENGAQPALLDTVVNGRPKVNWRGSDGFSDLADNPNDLIYIATDGTYEQLMPIYEQALKLPGVGRLMIHDDFLSDDPDLWFAEFFGADASKGSGISFIKEQHGFTHAVCFGDNLNDITMFEASDEGYAPANATDEVKAVATAIIGPNSADGVACWLEENLLR